ncbi:peptide ABC transporter substrate-binding protein [Donghicola eburneus]|uniref:Periplasmic murein peptide-binding protein n=1 Tax=Donghicola eburneus TaxID=393278 RepID=A0A1M4N3L9_9RHOB|nr:peptide ABC transporter substrate-binding protein [Donghicola eburneus]SCM67656.1 Periplasmic murein peptide-binding protein [Donghicola eburneus]SFQ09506.1 oligopeptide transport system substrate-binding protein [Donghicola eburneus]
MTYMTRTLLAAMMASTIVAGTATAATHPETGEALAADQTFTNWTLDNPSSFDPQVVEDSDGAAMVRNMFEGLMNQDADGNLVPGVALDYSVNDDKNVYTFTLRPEAQWSNGDPVVASDFVYAWQRAVDPELASPYAWFMELMSIENASAIIAGEMPKEELGVKAIDDHTLEVTLSASLPYFATMTTHSTTFPAPQKVIEEFGAEWTKPENIVVNGAFILEDYTPGERIVQVRNPEYWDNENTILDKIETLVVTDQNQALTRYLAGEFDRIELPAGTYPKMKAEHPDEAVSVPWLCNYYYTFNVSDSGPEAFKDVRVRQALSLAVDRKVITENVMQGGQPEAYSFTPAAVAGFEPPKSAMADMTQAERDAKAKELLAEAGYGADNPLTFDMIYNTSENHKKVAVVLSQMWKQKLGVQASLANMEWKTFLDTRGRQDFALARGAWCGDYNEASTFLDLLTTPSGYNDGKYSNTEYDELIQSAKTAENAPELYTQAEAILAEEMPVIPIYHYAGVMMIDTDLKGWPYQNVERNWYGKNLYKVAE